MTLHDPLRRDARLIVETAGDDVVVYDRDTDRVTALGATEAQLWQACDGTRSVADLAELTAMSEEEAAAALLRLDEAGLLIQTGMSRRSMMQKAGIVAGGVGAMSLLSIAAPVAAHASSLTPPPAGVLVGVSGSTPIIGFPTSGAVVNLKNGVYVLPPVVGTGFPANTEVTLTIGTYTLASGYKQTQVPVYTSDDGSFHVSDLALPGLGSAVTVVASTASGITTPVLSTVFSTATGVLGGLLGGTAGKNKG